MDDGTRDPEGFIEYRVIRLAEHLRRRFEATLRPLGLSPRQFSVLAVLRSRPNVTSADLARAVLTTPQSMGVILEQLEAVGLVQRRERRGRGVPSPASLSAEGERVLREAFGRVAELDDATREHLGEDYATLTRIVVTLEALAAE